ncbi:MAG: glycerol-3-phosphate acyltransferase [Clostridia bacterium]|nr:glycerol-3-phosphate acyltransferase [Clostridia bacterium]
MKILIYILLIIGSYFIGNISFARLISALKKEDITKKGSGNPGTINMIRNYGIKLGGLTLILDALKGAIPSLVGYLVFGGKANEIHSLIGLYMCGVSTIVGHIYPVCYKFKGGKGIASTLGVFLVANPTSLLIFFLIAFIYMLFFDYGSVASLLIVSALTIIESYMISLTATNNTECLILCILLFAIFGLTWFAHRKNIFRLLTGKENKTNLLKGLKKLSKSKNTK